MAPLRRWTDEQLVAAVKASTSVLGVLRHLGLKVGGGQHRNIQVNIQRLGLETSHFMGKGWNRGNWSGKLRANEPCALDDILVQNSTYYFTSGPKRKLIKASLLSNKCYECGMEPVWHGKPLVLRLDHVNGDNRDNRIENLRLLCPNCDSQMPTFAGRNKGHKSL